MTRVLLPLTAGVAAGVIVTAGWSCTPPTAC